LRREGRMLSAEPVCSCALSFVHVAHETAGAARTRPSLRPLDVRAKKFLAKLGRFKPRDREVMFSRHCEERQRRSNPCRSMWEDGLLRFARNDGDRPRRTGSLAFADGDSVLGSHGFIAVIAGNDEC
jgi:hypothetical protein